MATIAQVAQQAGVSTATVSHVINGTRRVSPELTERVRAAMAELGYRHNAVARSLRVQQTRTVGLIIPSVEIPLFAWMAHCIEAAADEAGYNVMLCNSGWSLEREQHYLRNLIERRVDGLMCTSLALNPEHLVPVLERGTPVVWLEESRGNAFDAVVTKNAQGAYEATKHLIALGHMRIGCITGHPHSQLAIARSQGYRKALLEHGLVLDKQLIRAGNYTPPAGLVAAGTLLDLSRPPTAIFAFNDMMALGAIQAVHERGLRIPEDVAIIGFDGIPMTEHTSPPLSTVEQPIPAMSCHAMQLLLDRINGRGPTEACIIKLDPRLIPRASTCGYAARMSAL